MDSALNAAVRELRTRLAGQTLGPLLFAAPGLRQALPIVIILLDQVALLEARVRTLEAAIDGSKNTLELAIADAATVARQAV